MLSIELQFIVERSPHKVVENTKLLYFLWIQRKILLLCTQHQFNVGFKVKAQNKNDV